MIILLPAYGRKYNCPQEIIKDWNDGKDFRVPMKGYMNKDDAESMKITHRHLRGSEIIVKYRKDQTVTVATI